MDNTEENHTQRYCSFCGGKTKSKKIIVGYYRNTGNPIFYTEYTCLKYRWYLPYLHDNYIIEGY